MDDCNHEWGGGVCHRCGDRVVDGSAHARSVDALGDGEDPLAVSESSFDDVDADSFYAPFIERMAELEVTRGCGDASGF